ncbi:T9SS type A sorting domain-containing protein [Mariniflexile sp.]|uniref:T9SS type A sorting domain-containing protein n=1 Tax=Mariniflexile sp. TaxID=1979402 RepID=UPI004048A3DD
MKIIISILVFVLGMFSTVAQITGASEKFALPSSLSESSGAIFFNNRLITHNDSGGENKLYELDTISGQVTRTISISNAINVDWEDMDQDDNYIYVGDIGNNVSGNRTDLKIYKINKNDYLSADTIIGETIAFSYSDQTDFTPSSANNTEWDAEALVSFDANNLILFTKNWLNGTTKGYLISKTPGVYSLSPLASSLNSGGLITGGTYNPFTGKLYLVGYTKTLQPFVCVSENFNGNAVFSGTNTQTMLASLGQEQAEAITFVGANRYFMTSESFSVSVGPFTFSDYAKLIAFSTNDVTLSLPIVVRGNEILLYPNPVDSFLHVKKENIVSIEIYDTKSVLLYKGTNRSFDMSVFRSGVYIVKINLKDHTSHLKKLIKK